jgi:hypothetical protein
VGEGIVVSVIQSVEGFFHLLIDNCPLWIGDDLPERRGDPFRRQFIACKVSNKLTIAHT